jgi:DNA replication protein DnaC
MLDYNTSAKLHELKLHAMANAFSEQAKDTSYNSLSFEERFGILVDTEWAARKSNRLQYLIRSAGYCFNDACLENIEYHADRKLDKAQILRLGTCNYIQQAHNIIILGATGSGKTYLSSAFGTSANRNFYTVKYVRTPDLLGELAVARANNTYHKVIKPYKQAKLLILDDWLLFQPKDYETRDILEIVETRYKKASTIFCSQFEPNDWFPRIGETTLADAICDRIVHDSYIIVIEGKDSMRKRKGISSK